MTRSTIYWVSALSLLVFGIAVLRRASTGAGHPPIYKTSKPMAAPSPLLGPRPSDNSRPDNSPDVIVHEVTPQKNAGTKPPTLPAVFGTDMSVIGTAFSVSASVTTTCKRDKIMCPEVYKKLSQLVEEPRDNAWASQTEANIQGQIESLGLDRYSIRNLECRTSVCAVEVESTASQYLGIEFYYMVKYSLTQGLATTAFETDSSGARIYVTLMTFSRWQHMCWNKPCDLSTMTPP